MNKSYRLPFATLLVATLALVSCQSGTPATQTPAAPAKSQPVQGSSGTAKQWSSPPPMTIDKSKTYTATIHTTNGDMNVELFASENPVTVNNFVFLAKQEFYNNVKFHRIIRDFMVQTGDPTGTGAGGPGYRFPDEKVTRKYVRGTVAMANAGKDTNGSQFFIVTTNTNLPPNYVIFGQLVDQKSLKTLDSIANTPVTTDPRSAEKSMPTENVLITGVDISEE